jgi:hypothetical protein
LNQYKHRNSNNKKNKMMYIYPTQKKMKNFFTLKPMLFACAFLLFISQASYAQKSWIGANLANWNVASNWSPSGVPTSSDAVTIASNGSVTVNITNAVCASLQLGGTSASTAGTITFASSGSPKLTVSGAVTMGGSNSNANRTGTITFVSGSTLECGSLTLGNASNSPAVLTMSANSILKTGSLTVGGTGTTWTPSTGTVELIAKNTLPSTIFTTFNNLIISVGKTTTGRDLTIASLTVNSADTFSLAHAVTANAVSLEGGCAVTGGTI